MPYSHPFHRLVLFGSIYADTFNTSLSIVNSSGAADPLQEPDSALLALVRPAIEEFWMTLVANGGAGITSAAKIEGFKLNRIGTDGKYLDNETHEHLFTPPGWPGGQVSTPPAQLSTVVTLRTFKERGLASKGRMYLPSCSGFEALGTDGLATIANAQRVATATANFIDDINIAYRDWDDGTASRGQVGVASNRGVGAFELVNRVTVGRVPDTMRSRRNKLDEDPQSAAVAQGPF